MASISVRNSGNVYSKPTITIKGKGNISVALGNTQLFSIVLPSASLNTIIIDSAEMNAYNEDGVFMNRAVTGDYSNFIFKVGLNNLTINGDISEVIISKYSRWI
jgi:phage-related protein